MVADRRSSVARSGQDRSPRLAADEWRWAIKAAAMIMGLTVIPYLLALDGLIQGQVFGVLPLSVEDGFSYLAKMQQGARGAWLFTLPYTSEPHDGVFLFSFYLLLGKLSGTDHFAQVIVFHAARVLFGLTSLLAFYRLSAEFTPRVKLRRLALLAYAFGGGLGWLALSFIPPGATLADYPLELYSPETFAIIGLLGWPHLLASRTLVILAVVFLLSDQPWRGGLALLVTAVIVPLSVIPVWGLALARIIIQARTQATAGPVVRSLGFFLLPALIVAYGVLVLAGHPAMSVMHAQLLLPSPSPFFFVLAYGPWWLLAGLGLVQVARRRPDLARLTGVWLVLGVILVYLPINTQRRLIEGYWPLLVAAGCMGLPAVARRVRAWSGPARRWLLPGLVAWTSPGSMLVAASAVFAVLVPAAPTYVPAAQAQIFARVAAERGVALGEWTTVAWAPAFTGLNGYAGHRVETLDPDRKIADIDWFYSTAPTVDERVAFLRQHDITIVFHGPLERALGAFDPATLDFLQPIGDPVEGYTAYRVVLPRANDLDRQIPSKSSRSCGAAVARSLGRITAA